MMAKGLGAIMAAVSMADEKAGIEKGETLSCTRCGHEMEFKERNV